MTTPCVRCAGLVVSEWDAEMRAHEERCANCGHRQSTPVKLVPVKLTLGKRCLCGQPKRPSKLMCWACRQKSLSTQRKRAYRARLREKGRMA